MIDLDVVMPREVLAQVIEATKTKGLTKVMSRGLADAIVDGLDRRGMVVAQLGDVIDPPDEHLRLLKDIRHTIKTTIDNGEIAQARDLAALTRRLQDVSREIQTLQERLRADGKHKKGSTAHGSATDTPRTAQSGQIDI